MKDLNIKYIIEVDKDDRPIKFYKKRSRYVNIESKDYTMLFDGIYVNNKDGNSDMRLKTFTIIDSASNMEVVLIKFIWKNSDCIKDINIPIECIGMVIKYTNENGETTSQVLDYKSDTYRLIEKYITEELYLIVTLTSYSDNLFKGQN